MYINVAEFELFILNRWGNTVAILKDVNEPWNGTTTNGTELTDGVYFYTYKLIGLNGDKKEGHGFITLIR
jgi:gliding motility-associated-like protein